MTISPQKTSFLAVKLQPGPFRKICLLGAMNSIVGAKADNN